MKSLAMADKEMSRGLFLVFGFIMSASLPGPVTTRHATSLGSNSLFQPHILGEQDFQEETKFKCATGQECHDSPDSQRNVDTMHSGEDVRSPPLSDSLVQPSFNHFKSDIFVVRHQMIKRAAMDVSTTTGIPPSKPSEERINRKMNRRKKCRDKRRLRKLKKKLRKRNRKGKSKKKLLPKKLKRRKKGMKKGDRLKCGRRNKGKRRRRKMKRRKDRKRKRGHLNEKDGIVSYDTTTSNLDSPDIVADYGTPATNPDYPDNGVTYDNTTEIYGSDSQGSVKQSSKLDTNETLDFRFPEIRPGTKIHKSDFPGNADGNSETTTRQFDLPKAKEHNLESMTRPLGISLDLDLPDLMQGRNDEVQNGVSQAEGGKGSVGDTNYVDTEFNVKVITELFHNTLVSNVEEGQVVSMDNYIKAYKKLVGVFQFFGPILSFAKTELVNKIRILDELRNSSAHGAYPDRYKTFENMFEYEFKEGISKPGGQVTSGVRENAWIHRPLKFIISIIRTISNKTDTVPLSKRVKKFYQDILAPHHSSIVRMGIQLALYSFPSRGSLLNDMNVADNAEGMQELTELDESLQAVCDAIQFLYDTYAHSK